MLHFIVLFLYPKINYILNLLSIANFFSKFHHFSFKISPFSLKILPFLLGNAHITRNAIFQIFRPPSLFVTKNPTNLSTRLRNKSLNHPPPPKKCYTLCGRSLTQFLIRSKEGVHTDNEKTTTETNPDQPNKIFQYIRKSVDEIL